MTHETQEPTRLTPEDWASAYAGFIAGLMLTALTYLSSAFGLDKVGLGIPGLVVIPIVVPLLVLVVLRGGYRLAALGLFLAAPVLWASFAIFLFAGGAVS
ncbi:MULTISPECIES: hypothetical protein [Dietzia]|uniref:hypothetical protein n=1 Tax=Dietzia TaxID=37914 RepID=UPI000D08B3D0|nr:MULTISPECIES: hypothetical protein [Dietzia]AVM63129.1 hypothetical protein C3V38_00600 [Dietzia sp. oral taxon 368]MCT1713477.1 hypothetical protein [Dietzia cinnamea]MCT2275524.1 hypothetical protein [Dietzia cinnamea]